jgi:hypothetical protein
MGERLYGDGNLYRGEFRQGERHGYGEMEYKSIRAKETWYKGEWCMNVRQGQGTL